MLENKTILETFKNSIAPAILGKTIDKMNDKEKARVNVLFVKYIADLELKKFINAKQAQDLELIYLTEGR